MNWREKRQLKRMVRQDLLDLRREHPNMTESEFRELADDYVRTEWDGIDPKNLEMILEFLKEILPILIKLFVVIAFVMLVPVAASAIETRLPLAPNPPYAVDPLPVADPVTPAPVDKASIVSLDAASEAIMQDQSPATCASGQCLSIGAGRLSAAAPAAAVRPVQALRERRPLRRLLERLRPRNLFGRLRGCR